MKIVVWLRTEWKRMRACIPGLALKAVILAVVVSMTAFCAYRIWSRNETEPVKIGYIAPDDKLTSLALTYIKHMDALKGWCSLSEMSSLEEGQEALQQQELAALIVLPEHVVEGIMDGTNEPAKLYLSGHSKALGYVFEELANAGIGMLAVAQAQIYATDDILSQAGIDRQEIEQQYQQIDMHNLNLVMNRSMLWREDSISATGTAGAAVYYNSAFLTCIMLIAGLFFGQYCRRTKEEERMTCYRLNVSYIVQAIGRNGITAILTAMLLVIPYLATWIPSCGSWIPSWEITGRNIILLLLLLLCSGAYTQLVYSLTRRANTTMLITCMSGLIQGYLSGCFLPSAILPQIVGKIAQFIPATYIKVAFTMILTGRKQQFGKTCLVLIGCIILFTIAEVILMHREEREKDIRPVHFMNKTGSSVSAILFRRLMHRKSLWFCLICTTILSCAMIRAERGSDTILRAVYYTNEEAVQALLDSYQGLVEFQAVDSEEELRRQVITGKAECGYVIEDNVLLQLQSDDLNRGIQVLEKEDAVLTGVVNEVLFGQLYTLTSYEWYSSYMEKLGIEAAQAKEALDIRMHDGSTFSFERQVMQPAKQQESGQISYPVWIIIAVQVILCGLLGAFWTYQDWRRHYYYKRSYAGILAVSVIEPMLLAMAVGILTIVFYNSY